MEKAMHNILACICKAISFHRRLLPSPLCSRHLHLHLIGEQPRIVEVFDLCRGTEESCRECAQGWQASRLLHSRDFWQGCKATGAVRCAEAGVQEQAAKP